MSEHLPSKRQPCSFQPDSTFEYGWVLNDVFWTSPPQLLLYILYKQLQD